MIEITYNLNTLLGKLQKEIRTISTFNILNHTDKFRRLNTNLRNMSSWCFDKGSCFIANSGTKAAVLPKGRSPTANSGTRLQYIFPDL